MDILNKRGLFQQLIMTATRLESHVNRHYFEPMGLTTTYCKIICILAEEDGLTPTEILHQIGGTKSNISQRLDVLENKGYAKRLTLKNGDKRNVRIELTPQGREKYRQLMDFAAAKSADLELHFSPEEKTHMQSIIKKLNLIMDAKDNEPRDP
jgi:DNA-binding MarR family transcriptional regulator